MTGSSAQERARSFLEQAEQFMLGELVTEQQHPETTELSTWAKQDLSKAYETIRKIDVGVLETAAAEAAHIEKLSAAVAGALADGGRVFISGCGATGRLALTLEYLWRQRCRSAGSGSPADAVVGFMAGGDLALVKSIENFEDHPEYGARQLRELGFGEEDLLLAVTEGGETPFVIGTAEEAARISRRPPWFLYCNPDDVLRRSVERSRRVIDNDQIEKLNLTTGPQVLSGSTRMQASTIQMFAAGLALLPHAEKPPRQGEPSSWAAPDLAREARSLAAHLSSLDLSGLAQLTAREAAIYEAGELVTYETAEFGMCVVTDTTERAPTFSLAPFENFNDPDPTPSWAYLSIPGTRSSAEAWEALLGRAPRALDWEGIEHIAGQKRLLGYDFSEQVPNRRARYGRGQHPFRVEKTATAIRLTLDEFSCEIDVQGLSLLEQFTLLKVLLNTHSTLVMGRLGRYESNVMLWVRPSNMKLIDRSVRYVLGLLQRDGDTVTDYERVVYELFRQIERLDPNQSIVWHTYKALSTAS